MKIGYRRRLFFLQVSFSGHYNVSKKLKKIQNLIPALCCVIFQFFQTASVYKIIDNLRIVHSTIEIWFQLQFNCVGVLANAVVLKLFLKTLTQQLKEDTSKDCRRRPHLKRYYSLHKPPSINRRNALL